MAATLPAALKKPDVQRFVTRAAQLEKYRPIVTYWCEYYILQYILKNSLHTTDPECADYAGTLMDKLETTKSENAGNDAIVDDVAAKAYIENFAMDTFSKADGAQRAGKVTKQTADTFLAAATFLDLLGIWGPLEAEDAAKSKFARYHALRIIKAFKAGEDPNDTNPVIEEPVLPRMEDDGVEAELKALEKQQNSVPADTVAHQPHTVEEAQDHEVEMPPSAPSGIDHAVSPETSFLPEPHRPSSNPRQGSLGGGYFPAVPSNTSSAPGFDEVSTPTAPSAPSQPSSQPPSDPADFYEDTGSLVSSSATVDSSPSAARSLSTNTFSAAPWLQPPPAHIQNQFPRSTPPAAPIIPHAEPAPLPAPVQQPLAAVPVGGYKTDDEATMAAQKHARWAISALNFEDVNTAVKELRLALRSLGAN